MFGYKHKVRVGVGVGEGVGEGVGGVGKGKAKVEEHVPGTKSNRMAMFEENELDPEIAKYVTPDTALFSKAMGAVRKFKENFQFTKVVEEKEKKKRHWRDFYDQGVELDDELKQAKKAKPGDNADKEEKGAVSFADIVSKQVDKIGSVEPVKDFKAMISRRDEAKVVERAIKEMAAMIMSLVKSSFGDTNFGKAIECLQALRVGCIKETEAKAFNDHLNDLKTTYQKKNEPFWRLVVSKNIMPIHKGEVPDSTFTADQAKKWAGPVAETPSMSLGSGPSASDDVFDSLE